jgi:AcrR family transcriptional regulator
MGNNKSKIPARQRLLDKASKLFYQFGINSVGIDRIIAESDVAKMTFYNHFPSKEALVIEFIKERDHRWRAWFLNELKERKVKSVPEIFDIYFDRFQEKDFRGCAFTNTIAEIADEKSPVHAVSADHKAKVIEILADFMKQIGLIGNVKLQAQQLMLLIDGAIVTAVRDGSPDSAQIAKKMAASLFKKGKTAEPFKKDSAIKSNDK